MPNPDLIMKEFLKKLKWFLLGPSKPVKKVPKQGPVSKIFPLEIPLEPDLEAGWKPYPLFKRKLPDHYHLSAHVSVLIPGHCPHLPHEHPEEEILMMLAGEADLLLPRDDTSGPERRRRVKAGDFVYYPANYPHSLEGAGSVPANYLMFKWSGNSIHQENQLGFLHFDHILEDHNGSAPDNFFLNRLFEGPTGYLGKLHCHFSQLPPGKGYKAHIDPYDVAIILMEGEVETLATRVSPSGVIFYGAGEPHGMYNPGTSTAKYLVFEFHFDKTSERKE
jgi:quercetin dioxygenase-like cupin family protein